MVVSQLSEQLQLSRSALVGISVGAVGAAFVGYCIYFDHKRRSAPDFKQKLKAKRSAKQAKKSERSKTQIPDISDPAQMQAYFLQEVQLGEELLAEGDFDGAVEHLSTAVVMCGQPSQLLQILRQTLPPQVFSKLVDKLPKNPSQRNPLAGKMASGDGPASSGVTLREVDDTDDLE